MKDSRRPGPRALLLALTILIAVTLAPIIVAEGHDDRREDDEREGYAIGLWGDLPYSDVQALTGVPNLIADMNRQNLRFTVHDGDLKGGNVTPGSRPDPGYHDRGSPGRTVGGRRKQSDRVMCAERPSPTLGHGHIGPSRAGI